MTSFTKRLVGATVQSRGLKCGLCSAADRLPFEWM